MALLKQSTAYTRMFLLVQSSDHVTGLTGATVTVTLSKAGGSFAALGGSVTEVSSGWYKISLNTTDTNTLGELAYHCTATSADPTDFVDEVWVRTLDDLAYPATSGRSMVVDAAGLVDANAVKVGPTGAGTAQTARDIGLSVLLSSGSGTGQLDFTSGVVKANLAQILGTALTETAGLLAGGFKKFFNVASPVSTCLGVNQTGDTYPLIGTPIITVSADIAGATLTNAQMGIILTGTASAGGASTITLVGSNSVDNNYRGLTISLTGGTGIGQSRIISGYVGATKVVTVDEAWTVQPDNTSTYLVRATRGAALDSSLRPSISAAAVQAIWDALTAAQTTAGSVGKLIVDNLNATITSVKALLPAALVGGRMDSSVGSYPGNTAQTGDNFARLGAPAGASVSADIAAVKVDTAAIKVKTDNLPASPAAVGSAMTLTAAYDLAKTASQAGDAMALTSGERTTLTGVMWAALVSGITTANSIGKRIIDYLTGDVYARVGAPAGASVSADVAAVKADTAAIKAKTDNLPSDPADASDIAASFVTVNSKLDTIDDYIDTEVAAIKAKTDNLPSDPADASDIATATTAIFNRIGAPVGASISADIAALPTAAMVTNAVLDELLSAHTVAGSVGAGISSAASAGDPLATAVPGAYGAGTAGKIIGDITANFSTVNTKLDTIDDYVDTEVAAIKAKTDNLPASPAATGDAMTLTAGERTSIAAATWAALSAGLTTANSIGKRIVDFLTGDSYARLGAPAGASVSADVAAIKADTAAAIVAVAGVQSDTDNIQTRLPAALVSGRMDSSVGAYPGNTAQTGDAFVRLGAPAGASASADIAAIKAETALIKTDSTAIKAKTDNLPGSPAAVGSAMTLTVAYDAAKTAAQAGDSMGLTSAGADALLDRAAGVETGWTLRQSFRVFLAALGGKANGGGTALMHYRDQADTKNRITATVDASGNRTAVTLDPS